MVCCDRIFDTRIHCDKTCFLLSIISCCCLCDFIFRFYRFRVSSLNLTSLMIRLFVSFLWSKLGCRNKTTEIETSVVEAVRPMVILPIFIIHCIIGIGCPVKYPPIVWCMVIEEVIWGKKVHYTVLVPHSELWRF